MGKKNRGTKLADLPVESDIEADDSELAVLNSILNMKEDNPEEYEGVLKYVMYATGIFVILSLPFTDRVIELALPIANSWLVLVGLKAIVFFVLFYVILYMSRQN